MEGKRGNKNGGYGDIKRMSNMELLGKLKSVAIFLSKNSKSAMLANDILKEMGLPRSNFREDFKIKSYHDKLYKEAVSRGLLEHNRTDSWYNPVLTVEDVLEKIETAYYLSIQSDSKGNGLSISELDRLSSSYEQAKIKARTLKIKAQKN